MGESQEDTREPAAADVIVGPPRWVKVFAAIALLLLVLFVLLLVTGRGGEHGPGRHGFGGSWTGGGNEPAHSGALGEQQPW
jgi:hypothetical protein